MSVIIDDLRAAEAAADESNIALRWAIFVAVARSVGHVLRAGDGRRSPYLGLAAKVAYDQWKGAPDTHYLFSFLERERNNVLKEYRSSVIGYEHSRSTTVLIFDDILYRGRVFDRASYPDKIHSWWESEITRIEGLAHKLKKAARQRSRAAKKLTAAAPKTEIPVVALTE